MDIDFATTKLRKVLNSHKSINTGYGPRMARTIMSRMALLKNAKKLADIPTTKPVRRHQLTQNRDEQFAIDLCQPHRLIFKVNHCPIPRQPSGGIDEQLVTAIKIIEITDYH